MKLPPQAEPDAIRIGWRFPLKATGFAVLWPQMFSLWVLAAALILLGIRIFRRRLD